jgi:hypothetical protein
MGEVSKVNLSEYATSAPKSTWYKRFGCWLKRLFCN